MRISVRAETPVVTLVFDSLIAEKGELVETVRIQTTLSHLRRMSDVLSETLRQVTVADEDVSVKL